MIATPRGLAARIACANCEFPLPEFPRMILSRELFEPVTHPPYMAVPQPRSTRFVSLRSLNDRVRHPFQDRAGSDVKPELHRVPARSNLWVERRWCRPLDKNRRQASRRGRVRAMTAESEQREAAVADLWGRFDSFDREGGVVAMQALADR